MTRQKVLVTKKADPESGPKSRGQTVGQYLATMYVRLDTFSDLEAAGKSTLPCEESFFCSLSFCTLTPDRPLAFRKISLPCEQSLYFPVVHLKHLIAVMVSRKSSLPCERSLFPMST
jgi:hypothetical protein